MVKESDLQYSTDTLELAWKHNPLEALAMSLRMSGKLAVEEIQRDLRSSALPPLPERGDRAAEIHAREIANWAAQAVANRPTLEKAAAERVTEAAQTLEVIADIRRLLVTPPTLPPKLAMADAILHGVLLARYGWRNPPYRRKGSTRSFTDQQLEEILQRMENGEPGASAARAVLGEIKNAVPKNVYDHAVKSARRLQAKRAKKST